MGETFKERLKETFSFKPGGGLRIILIPIFWFLLTMVVYVWFALIGTQTGMSPERIIDSMMIEFIGALYAAGTVGFLAAGLEQMRQKKNDQEWQAMRDDIAYLKAQVERLVSEQAGDDEQADADVENEEEEQIPIPEPAAEGDDEVEQVDPPTG